MHLTGAIDLNGRSLTLIARDSTTLELAGPISGSGQIRLDVETLNYFTSAGTVKFAGSAPNTFTGAVTVASTRDIYAVKGAHLVLAKQSALAVPGALRLWRFGTGRAIVVLCLGWSVVATTLLHWLPLTGYVSGGHYFVSDAVRKLPLLAPFDAFPAVTPAATSNFGGLMILLTLWSVAWIVIRPHRRPSTRGSRHSPDSGSIW